MLSIKASLWTQYLPLPVLRYASNDCERLVAIITNKGLRVKAY